MTAAEQRAALAAIGSDLVALGGDTAARRGAALVQAQDSAPPPDFADIAQAPAWLRLTRPDLERLAVHAALFAIAPSLASSIDGEWLGECARRADEIALDRAMESADRTPEGGMAAFPAADLSGLGFDLMRANLASGLTRYLDWAPTIGAAPSAALAAYAIAEAGA